MSVVSLEWDRGFRKKVIEVQEEFAFPTVWVSGNFRLTFHFIGENAEIADYQDYH